MLNSWNMVFPVLAETMSFVISTCCCLSVYAAIFGTPIVFYLFRIGFFDMILNEMRNGKKKLSCSWTSSKVAIFFQKKGWIDFVIPNEVTLDQEFDVEEAKIFGMWGPKSEKFDAVGVLRKNFEDLNYYLKIRAEVRGLRFIVRGSFDDKTKIFTGYYILGMHKAGQIKGRLNWLIVIKEQQSQNMKDSDSEFLHPNVVQQKDDIEKVY